ncbi:unnamed protein product, partial [Closterium sp. NIES-64]
MAGAGLPRLCQPLHRVPALPLPLSLPCNYRKPPGRDLQQLSSVLLPPSPATAGWEAPATARARGERALEELAVVAVEAAERVGGLGVVAGVGASVAAAEMEAAAAAAVGVEAAAAAEVKLVG